MSGSMIQYICIFYTKHVASFNWVVIYVRWTPHTMNHTPDKNTTRHKTNQ